MKINVIAKCAMSLDGYIDDATNKRLILSGPEDRNAVDELRATCDGILIGAGTLRADDPSLGLRRDDLQRKRIESGLPAEPARIVVTRLGHLPTDARLFTTGSGRRIVVAGAGCDPKSAEELRRLAELYILEDSEPSPIAIIAVLADLGVTRLLIEGGSSILTQFVSSNAIDQLRVAVAPFFVGDARSPRAFKPADYLHNPDNRMTLDSVNQLGDVAVLTYSLQTG